MIGPRVGIRCGLNCGLPVGLSADPLGGSSGQRSIIAIAGQSNAVGFADIDDATLKATYSVAYTAVSIKARQGTNANPPVWTVYPTRAVQPKPESATLNFGIPPSLARYVDARHPNAWGLVEIGIGDTSLNVYWKKGSVYPTTPPHLFDQMITYLQQAEVELGGRIAAFIWIQGEKDANTSTDANLYEANLTQFIADIRAVWPGLPFIYNRLSNTNPGTAKATVRTAQANVDAAVTGTAMINVDDLALQGDNLHFTADSYVTLGNRFGTAVLEALGINTLLASFTTSTAGLQVTATDTSTDEDGSVTGWSYDWGDGSTSSTQNPSHTYAADGTYTITLTATDNTGGTDTYSASVTVAAPTWTIDATSSKAAPADATEWAAFNTALSPAFSAPTNLWLFQNASGNLSDIIGGKTLTSAGSPTYQKAVTGWSRKAIGASGAASNQTLNNTGMPNANANSSLLLIYAMIAQPVATHTRAFMGASSGNDFQGLAGSTVMRLRTGANIGNSSLGHTGQVRPYVLRWDRASSVNALYSDKEKLSVTFGSFSGAELRFTLGIAADTTADTQVLYAALWTGTAAERTEAEIKTMLTGLGWSVTGW